MDLFASLASKRLFISNLYNNTKSYLGKTLGKHPIFVSYLSALSYLGIKLTKKELKIFTGIIEVMQNNSENLSIDIIMDLLMLTSRSEEKKLGTSVIVDDFVEKLKNWSPIRDQLKDNPSEFIYKPFQGSDRKLQKIKVTSEVLNQYAEIKKREQREKRKKKSYQIMANETNVVEDIGSKEDFSANNISQDKAQTSLWPLDLHSNLNKERLVKLWCLLLHYNAPPKDALLYTYCNDLLQKDILYHRSNPELKALLHGLKKRKINGKLFEPCLRTGWIPNLTIDHKSDNKRKTAILLKTDENYYTSILSNNESERVLFGLDEMIANQLKSIGNYKVFVIKTAEEGIQHFT